MKPTIKLIVVVSLVLIAFTACDKVLQVPLPVNEITEQSVFADPGTISSAVAGMYTSAFHTSSMSFAVTEFGGYIADDLHSNSTYAAFAEFEDNGYTAQDPTIEAFWSSIYQVIYTTNNIINTLPGSTVINSSLKTQYIGEAKFLRAYSYFYLTNFFGNIPLILTTSVSENSSVKQSSKAVILAQVIADLKDAETALQGSNNQTTLATSLAASALLARTYLYTKDWANAEASSTAVISSGQFQLPTNLNSVFLRSSTESIFHIATDKFDPATLNYTVIGAELLPASGAAPNDVVTSELLNAFEPGDKRKASWIGSINSGGAIYNYVNKYKQSSPPADADSAEDIVVLRLGEQYLIRAEARAQENNISGSVADLNVLRTRAGLPNLPSALTTADLLLAVEQERRVELFAEWANRWFDLIRTGRADQVLDAEKPGIWKSKDALFPIPYLEIKANPALVQNPGY